MRSLPSAVAPTGPLAVKTTWNATDAFGATVTGCGTLAAGAKPASRLNAPLPSSSSCTLPICSGSAPVLNRVTSRATVAPTPTRAKSRNGSGAMSRCGVSASVPARTGTCMAGNCGSFESTRSLGSANGGFGSTISVSSVISTLRTPPGRTVNGPAGSATSEMPSWGTRSMTATADTCSGASPWFSTASRCVIGSPTGTLPKFSLGGCSRICGEPPGPTATSGPAPSSVSVAASVAASAASARASAATGFATGSRVVQAATVTSSNAQVSAIGRRGGGPRRMGGLAVATPAYAFPRAVGEGLSCGARCASEGRERGAERGATHFARSRRAPVRTSLEARATRPLRSAPGQGR